MRPLLPLVIAFAASLLAGTAGAADAWRATRIAGEVRIEIAGAQAVPLTLEMSIADEASIETAASGSATLVRGEERVVVAPNSRLRLPAPSADGYTRIIEEFGSLFFQVGKRTAPHFRVETPLLAATVKGTSFIVTVDHKGANVDVKEGLVLVHNSLSTDETLVGAGRSASVMLSHPATLYLDRSVVPPSGWRLRLGRANDDVLAPIAADPASTQEHKTALQGASSTAALQGASSAVAFTAAAVQTSQSPATLVIDSTLTGIGFGIIAAALAIAMIGSNWRGPRLAAAKAKRPAKSERK